MDKTKVLFKMFYLYHKAAFDPLIELFENDPEYDVALSLTHEVVIAQISSKIIQNPT